jgi:RHS repeat-associated protein
LDTSGAIVGQVIDLAAGVTVGLDRTGQPVRFAYPQIDGSVAWRSTGSTPSATETYDAWGTWNSAAKPQIPSDALSLVMDQMGWGAGQGGITMPVDHSLVQLGTRTYDTISGRFLQPDSTLSSANLYAYADGDPIDGTDSSGNFGSWGDIFSMMAAVVVGLIAAVAAPITGGASATLLGIAATLVTSAAIDFGASVLGQVIDGGPINWAEAGINAAIGTGISLLTFGVGRILAAPAFMAARKYGSALFTGNLTKVKAYWNMGKASKQPIGDVVSYANIQRGLLGQVVDQKLQGVTFWKMVGKRLWWTKGVQRKNSVSIDDLLGGNLSERSFTSIRSYKTVSAEVVPNPKGSVSSESSFRPRAPLERQTSYQQLREQSVYQPSVTSQSIHDSTKSITMEDYMNSFMQNNLLKLLNQ